MGDLGIRQVVIETISNICCMLYPNRIIRKGESDAAIIIAIQKQLVANGIGSFQFIGKYGPKTFAAVKLFQSTHTDQLGNPLIIDGEVGALTWAALFGKSTVPTITAFGDLAVEVLKVARSQVGIMEVPAGSNSGREVNEYLQSVNCGPGNFWCAAFIYWCFQKATVNLGRQNPLVKTAGCLDHWRRTQGAKVLSRQAVDNPSSISPGAVFIIDHGQGFGHTGLVAKVEGGMIHTIEGNSNPGGGRNGLGVFNIVRKINMINKGFIVYS
jgi:cell wall-associated NlpC family hydrolase